MSIYAARLKKMTTQAKKQMEDYVPGGRSVHPAGEFKFKVQAELGETNKEPARMQISFQFTNAEGDYEGRKAFVNCIIEGGKDDGKTAKQICRGYFEDLGKEWPEDDLSKIEKIIDEINAEPPLVSARVTIRKSGEEKQYENNNVTITEVLNGETPAEDLPQDDANTSESPADENQTKMLTLCEAFSLEGFDGSMSTEDIAAKLKKDKIKFKEEELQPEERRLLEEVDSSLIEWTKKAVEPKKRVVSRGK
jgi:hypothetical protein